MGKGDSTNQVERIAAKLRESYPVIDQLLTRMETAERERDSSRMATGAAVAELGRIVSAAEPAGFNAKAETMSEFIARQAARIAELEAAADSEGEGCALHVRAPHGKEADELRAGVESLFETETCDSTTPDAIRTDDRWRDALRELLDRVDARDSLAHVRANEELESARAALSSACRVVVAARLWMRSRDAYVPCEHETGDQETDQLREAVVAYDTGNAGDVSKPGACPTDCGNCAAEVSRA